MIPQIKTVISAYQEFFSHTRVCACRPGDDPFNILIEGEKVGKVCRAHAWLERQRVGYQTLVSTGVCYPIPAKSLAGSLNNGTKGLLGTAFRKIGIAGSDKQREVFLNNPIKADPIILEMTGGGKTAAEIAYFLSTSEAKLPAYTQEHIVAYTNTPALVTARMSQRDEVVNSILTDSPIVVLLNSYDGRTRKRAWEDLAYTRTYGWFIVINGEGW